MSLKIEPGMIVLGRKSTREKVEVENVLEEKKKVSKPLSFPLFIFSNNQCSMFITITGKD